MSTTRRRRANVDLLQSHSIEVSACAPSRLRLPPPLPPRPRTIYPKLPILVPPLAAMRATLDFLWLAPAALDDTLLSLLEIPDTLHRSLSPRPENVTRVPSRSLFERTMSHSAARSVPCSPVADVRPPSLSLSRPTLPALRVPCLLLPRIPSPGFSHPSNPRARLPRAHTPCDAALRCVVALRGRVRTA